jgi:cation-transporting ATPase E
MESASVFGRVQPAQKQAMVKALQSRGHVVAMTGDGVNDVVALKDADIGVAMGSGSEAARGVAQLVLLDDDFSVVPSVVAEGRRVIANVERVANLFITKTVYALLLALAVGAAGFPFPFLPRHLTIVSSLTIGIPAFFLALAPNHQRFRPGFVGRVLRFAVPAGLVAAAATFTAYAVSRSQADVTLQEARTTATAVLFAIGLMVLVILERPLTMPRRGLTAGVTIAFVVVLLTPGLRRWFDLQIPPVANLFAAIGVAAIGMGLLDIGWRVTTFVQQRRAARSRPGRVPVDPHGGADGSEVGVPDEVDGGVGEADAAV